MERAKEGAEAVPAFWLRGIPPSTWTTPAPCSTEDPIAFPVEKLENDIVAAIGTPSDPLCVCATEDVDGAGQ